MVEIIDVIDIKRTKTGKTAARGKKLGKDEYFLTVHVWIVNSNGEILIQRRSPNKKVCPDLWSVTGGVVATGESSWDTCCRETLEEIGIDVSNAYAELIGQAKEPDEWGSLVDVWLIKTDFAITDTKMQVSEVCDIKWADLNEITKLIEEQKFAPNVLFALDVVLDNCGLR